MISVSRETRDRLERLKRLILDEAARQNLIAASTVDHFDERHMQDSLQLLQHLKAGPLLDIGSGGGLPGLALACCVATPVHLVEPRSRRATFLHSAAEELGLLDHVTVHHAKVESITLPAVATITARAVASLDRLFAMASHLAEKNTRWVLPKGRSAALELEAARRTWQGEFRLVPSETDDSAAIVIAEAVRRRQGR